MNIDWSQVVTASDRATEQAKVDYDAWKADRQGRVDAITVIVDEMEFNGDETSQNRMARAVTAADQLTDTTPWTLHDNSVATVTIRQLKAACRLAGEAQTAIWNEGRPR